LIRSLPVEGLLKHSLLVCFSLGFLVRLVPELLAFPLPIGYDIVYYASVMKGGIILSSWSQFFNSGWLINAITVPLYSVVGSDPFLVLKIMGPVLFGLNVAGVYWFAKNALGWSRNMGLLAGAFFAVQLASLRISWDLLDNTLGLAILLFALALVSRIGTKRGFVGFAVLSVLAVLADQFTAVILIVVVLGLIVWRLRNHKVGSIKRLALGAVPAFFVFLVGFGLVFFPISTSVVTNVLNSNDVVAAHPGNVFFIVNYLQVRTDIDSYGAYWNLALSVALLFGVLYLSYLFLVWKGFFNNELLTPWTILLLIGGFGCLIVPFSALEYWYRWVFMLVYPFTFYAVKGIASVLKKWDANKSIWASNKKVVAMISVSVLLGSIYLATPVLMNNTGDNIASIPSISTYFSTSPTVPYEDVGSVVQAMNWLNGSMISRSAAILQQAFYSWGLLDLGKSHTIVYFEVDPQKALDFCFRQGFSKVYFVWWNVDIGWYGIKVPSYFVPVKDFGRISVYSYAGENSSGN
jgi:hypothetical protein